MCRSGVGVYPAEAGAESESKIADSVYLCYTSRQGRNQLFISGGGKFLELSFDVVIVLIQPWYNFFANGHRYVLFAAFPKMRIY